MKNTQVLTQLNQFSEAYMYSRSEQILGMTTSKNLIDVRDKKPQE